MKHMLRPLVLACGFISVQAFAAGEPAAAPAPAPAPAVTEEKPAAILPLEDLRLFVEVMERIRNSYVEPVDDRTLFENAIRGMLTSLDPHSTYMDGKSFQDLQETTSGEFGGIGLEVGMEDGLIKVISPMDDTPAARAGIKSGDFIIKLDDKLVKGMTLQESVNAMRGKPGTKLRLTLLRAGEAAREVELVRSKIEVTSVRSRMLDGGFAVLRISIFQLHTGRDLVREIEKLRKQGPINGVVLDLRNNPGGVLTGAVEVADTFLDKGLVVYTQGRAKDSEVRFEATSGEALPGVPVVVLINGGSASASEIVAGALQDQRRAIVMGSTSFGKGSVQTVLPLAGGRGIKMTTARYYTPSGRSIQAQGIKPDIEVEAARVTRVESQELIKEADLKGHLDNTQQSGDAAKTEKKENEKLSLAEQDYPLYEALNVLKAAVLLKPVSPVAAAPVTEKTVAPASAPAASPAPAKAP